MSFFRRLLGSSPPPPVARMSELLLWDLPRGAHFSVHGESYRQDAIKALRRTCEPHPEEDGRLTCDVWLVAEPTNPVDPNAVAVHGPTGLVGYLPRDAAPEFGPVLAELALLGYQGGRCGALVDGGEKDKPHLGVVLLLSSPKKCLRAITQAQQGR